MSVYKKLQQARIALQGKKLTKSGKNKFAGYDYFELGDFLPTIQTICNDVGLCGVVSFNHEMAFLQINDVEDGTSIMFTSPMSSAALKGCHDVQNLGAVQTYLRRYLWTNAFEIVEHDALDATLGKDEPTRKPEPKPIVEAKPVAKPKPTNGPWQISLADNEDIGAWMDTLGAGCDALLQLATSVDDVATIFKTNRSIFDKAKSLDETAYSKIMEKFSSTKKSLIKA
jgi:hypothetical protein